MKLFTVGLTGLMFWLRGVVIGDIGDWPGPDYSEVEQRLLDPKLLDQQEDLSEQIAGGLEAEGVFENLAAKRHAGQRDFLCQRDFLLPLQQRDLAHLGEVHADRIVDAAGRDLGEIDLGYHVDLLAAARSACVLPSGAAPLGPP